MRWEKIDRVNPKIQRCFNVELNRRINVDKSTLTDVATLCQHVSTLNQRLVFAGNETTSCVYWELKSLNKDGRNFLNFIKCYFLKAYVFWFNVVKIFINIGEYTNDIVNNQHFLGNSVYISCYNFIHKISKEVVKDLIHISSSLFFNCEHSSL